MKESKQMSIYMTPEVWAEVQKLKKQHYDKSYGEVLRMMLLEGAKAFNKKKATA